MTFNPNDPAHSEARKRDLLQQARRQHLIREAQAGKIPVADRLLGLVGDLLVKQGRRWQARSQRTVSVRLHATETQHARFNEYDLRESA